VKKMTREELEILVRVFRSTIIIQDICFFVLFVVFILSFVTILNNC